MTRHCVCPVEKNGTYVFLCFCRQHEDATPEQQANATTELQYYHKLSHVRIRHWPWPALDQLAATRLLSWKQSARLVDPTSRPTTETAELLPTAWSSRERWQPA